MVILFLPHVLSKLLLLLLLLFSKTYSESDIISQSQSFTNGNTLVSKYGTFVLGFFNPGTSSNRFVGIWYKNIGVGTVVWVANRDNPIKDNSNSSMLIINKEGNLVLLNHDKSLWSTNATKKASSPIVQLLGNGNLVVREENDETSFLWQSFDYPCDTLLPEMKLRWDKKTGFNMHVTAWKNWDDPSSGDFTAATVPGVNPELIVWKGSKKFYRTGPWSGSQISGIVTIRDNPVYNYEFVNNEDEMYFRFTLKNSSVISIIVYNQTLSLRQRLVWISESRIWTVYNYLPQDNCDLYNVCGVNGKCVIDGSPICQCLDGFTPKTPQRWNAMDWTQGCVRSGNWSCGVENRDGFHKLAMIKLPETTHCWVDAKMSLDDCKTKCLENCSCTAYASLDSRGKGSGCSLWFGDLFDLRVSKSGQDLYVRTDLSDKGDEDGSRKKIALGVSITVSMAFVMLLAFSYIYKTKAKKKEKILWMESKDEGSVEGFELPLFDLNTILKATNKFSIENMLGEGGFGPVYKGTLLDGLEIAVKRLSKSSVQGLEEFKSEVILCAKLQHRNLVKVVGCCIEGEEKMLLYEYMPNKSLDRFLFDSVQRKLLDWSMRFNILYGIARGLLYLHQDSRLRIIHRDLKVSNILLDNDMNPKISDFGLARMCGGDQIEGKTSRIVGTYGYMSPEYVTRGLFSTKSDVFSFGVIMLEIITGRKNKAFSYQGYHDNLIEHACRLWKEGTSDKLADDFSKDSCIQAKVSRCIQIALLCLQYQPDDRPDMTSVIVMLSSENSLPQPKDSSSVTKKVLVEEFSSTNEVTISMINAR